jgi:hypothetical protein
MVGTIIGLSLENSMKISWLIGGLVVAAGSDRRLALMATRWISGPLSTPASLSHKQPGGILASSVTAMLRSRLPASLRGGLPGLPSVHLPECAGNQKIYGVLGKTGANSVDQGLRPPGPRLFPAHDACTRRTCLQHVPRRRGRYGADHPVDAYQNGLVHGLSPAEERQYRLLDMS